ncbi:hypothetical protein [Natrinema pallidum]|uniref:Uncharacterized protein n=1 Tax=Natrinema pallidum TaxID=69527 RepID=A0A4P9TFM2_9EURY|nr:hypothetical protein [Natrinema pallidum]QCW03628.1 hypothetical protein FGF80_10415 [Natrinema pallidum]
MNAEIIDEDDQGIGVRVVDNKGVKHTIAIGFSGEVQGHSQEGYPDDSNHRTPEEHEMIHQAENYAKFYISNKNNHGKFRMKPQINRLERVKQIISNLSDTEFEAYFGDLYKQVLGKHPDIEPPVERPPEVGLHDFVLFVVDVYLDDEENIEAVSDIHLVYYDDEKNQQELRNDDPFEDRTPDASVQLVADFIPSLDVFREYVIYNLRCQIRDCYHEMGLEPPEEYRVLGRGDHEIAKRYRNDDIPQYDHYHDESAEVPGYELDFDYGFGDLGKASAKSLVDDDTDYSDADIQALFDPTGASGGGLLDTVRNAIGGERTSNSESGEETETGSK